MKYKILISILVLTAVSMACSVFIGGPEYPSQTVPISTDEAQAVKTQIADALTSAASSGYVTVNITESQLTSLITNKMAQQENPPFTEPMVLLRDNQMQLYGKLSQGTFLANMLIIATVSVDPATNAPKIEIVSADFGPIPAPEGINAAINAAVAEAFTGSFGPVAIGFRLEAISIADGVMTMTGRIK